VPDDLKAAVDATKEAGNDVCWVVFGYEKNNVLKLVATGAGDYTEMCETLCNDSELHYGLMNSPDGVKCGFVEWTGTGVSGMKRAYILRNKGEVDKLIGYVHHRFSGEDKDVLMAEIHEKGIYEGDSLIGKVKGWEPSIMEWRALWNQTDPIGPWDPSTTWIYNWNPYGDLSFGNLPEEDKPKLKALYKRLGKWADEILPEGTKQKIKQLSEAETDDDLPTFTEEDMVTLARVQGMFDIVDERNGPKETGKLVKHEDPEPPKEPPKEPRQLKQVEVPIPEPIPDDPVPDPEPVPEPDPVPEPVPEPVIEPEVEPEMEPESGDENPDDIPEEKKYFVYTTSLGANQQVVNEVEQIKMILTLKDIKFEEVDLYMDGMMNNGMRRKEMQARSGYSSAEKLPQIFINDVYLDGGFEEFMFKNELGEL
jgi:hypothetical protein